MVFAPSLSPIQRMIGVIAEYIDMVLGVFVQDLLDKACLMNHFVPISFSVSP